MSHPTPEPTLDSAPLLAPEHPQRLALASEVHARRNGFRKDAAAGTG